MDLATIAQTVSAIGTVLLAALFGHFRDGLNYLAPRGGDRHRLGPPRRPRAPAARDGVTQEGITVTSRHESLTGEPYETLWTINPLLIPGDLYAPQQTGATD